MSRGARASRRRWPALAVGVIAGLVATLSPTFLVGVSWAEVPEATSTQSPVSRPPLIIDLRSEGADASGAEAGSGSGASEKPGGTAPHEPLAAELDRQFRARNTPAESALLIAVVGAIFAAVGLVALRHRTRVCPRCLARLVSLGDPADAAVADLASSPAKEPADRRDLRACLSCGELGMVRAGLLFRSGGRCPRCARWALASRYQVVEPSTYLMYGLVRVEEACACGYEAIFHRSTPPNEAPPPDWPIGARRA